MTPLKKIVFQIGDLVICNNTASFFSHGIAPPLEKDKGYVIANIRVDREGNEHLDVGLKMGEQINYVTSFETREMLHSPNDEWWCHPSRFHRAKIKFLL